MAWLCVCVCKCACEGESRGAICSLYLAPKSQILHGLNLRETPQTPVEGKVHIEA